MELIPAELPPEPPLPPDPPEPPLLLVVPALLPHPPRGRSGKTSARASRGALHLRVDRRFVFMVKLGCGSPLEKGPQYGGNTNQYRVMKTAQRLRKILSGYPSG